tara:strand:+ start:471 stop:665 length:195 start_codon:yes stop_codon:yes gene_type:complete
MTIKIDQRSEQSTYIIAGDITVYIEHSKKCAEEYVSIWETSTGNTIHQSSWNFDSGKRDIEPIE